MTNSSVNNFNRLCWAIAGLISFCSLVHPATPSDGRERKVDFQVVADKAVYSPGSTMNVKFILTNTGETPLYVPRSLSECSNVEGSFFFRILDEKDNNVTGKECSSDVGPAWETHVMDQVIDPKLWIVLGPGEIFGKMSTFELPKRKGTYRLKAELTPPGFSDTQREILGQSQIRVLRFPCAAPIVRVTVK
jgi:hypothetical protein